MRAKVARSGTGDPSVNRLSSEEWQKRTRLGARSAVLAVALYCAPGAPAAVNHTLRPEAEFAAQCVVGRRAVWTADDPTNGSYFKPNRWVLALQIHCGLPFVYELNARNGTYKTQTKTAVPPGFTASVPYNVFLYMPLGGLAAYCHRDSRVLASWSPCSGDSGTAVESEPQIHVDLMPMKEVPLPGKYSEQITLTVGLRL